MPAKQASQGPKPPHGEVPVKHLTMTLESEIHSSREKVPAMALMNDPEEKAKRLAGDQFGLLFTKSG